MRAGLPAPRPCLARAGRHACGAMEDTSREQTESEQGVFLISIIDVTNYFLMYVNIYLVV